MRTITTEELKRKAKEYYAARRLTAQNSMGCVLREDDCRCAIGAAMTDEEINKANDAKAPTVKLLVDNNIISFENIPFAIKLQHAHDVWCCEVNFRKDKRTKEQDFLELLK